VSPKLGEPPFRV